MKATREERKPEWRATSNSPGSFEKSANCFGTYRTISISLERITATPLEGILITIAWPVPGADGGGSLLVS